jgi:hypothetical protein
MTEQALNRGSSDAVAHAERLIGLVEKLARQTIDGDFVDGEEYFADGNDDEIDALYAFVHDARALLGLDDPQGLTASPTEPT